MRLTKWAAVGPTLALVLAACTSSATPVPTTAPTGAPSKAPTAAPATTAPTAAPTAAPVKIRFRFDWIETPGDTAMRIALNQGFFRDAGLDVTTTVGTGSTDSVTLTGAGQFDIAQASSLAVVVGVGAGVPIKSVGVLYQGDPNGMISRPDNPIRVPTDLYGKRYGIQQGSSLLYYQAVVAVNNLDRAQITEVPTGFDIAPLAAKQIDGLIDFADGEVILVRQAIKAEPVFVPIKDWGVVTYGTTLIVNNYFADQKPEVVRAFVLAFAKGLKFAVENPDQTVSIMQQVYSSVDRATLGDRVRAALKYFTSADTTKSGVLFQNTGTWQAELDLALKLKMIKSALTFRDVMNNGFLPNPPLIATVPK